jgi:bilin biosynthesis protein
MPQTSEPLNPDETDALYEAVRHQIIEKTFNATTDETQLQQMIESLGDKRGITRLNFAEAIGAIGTPATPHLIQALKHHTNPVVRRAAAKTLTLIADPKAVPTLIHSLLNDPDTVVRTSVTGALARTGEASVPALLNIIAAPETPQESKGLATWALAFIGSEAKTHIIQAINSPIPEVRTAVITTLGTIAQETREENIIALLLQALDDPNPDTRSEATTALSNIQHQPAVPKLIQLLETHPHPETRKAAALALMKIGNQTALPHLQTATQTETSTIVLPVIKLAIVQLQKTTHTEDDWN